MCLSQEPELLDLVKAGSIRLESNPRSNIVCGIIKNIKDLNLDLLLNYGVLVSINSDDPAMWNRGSLSETILDTCIEYGYYM